MNPTQQLESAFVGCQLKIRWLGITKTLTGEQTALAAQQFDADAKLLRATKKILDTKNPIYAALVTIRDDAKKAWKEQTIPYTEPGIRLLKKDCCDVFSQGMGWYKTSLTKAVNQLWFAWAEIKETASQKLGSLYRDSDYPDFPEQCFDIEWHYISVLPPVSLKDAYPAIYEEECQKARAKLDEAVKLTEQAFAHEFSEMVKHLQERLSDAEDGKKKIFKESAVTNLKVFFDRFKKLNLSSNADLELLVKDAELALLDTTAKDLRTSESARNYISSTMKEIGTKLDTLVVAKPRRKLLLPETPSQELSSCTNGSPGAVTPSAVA